ncbi:putative transcription factor interactor and regulator CCHC(Zn) family [Rosa chinensis]|uniref:Putative transcription factor interactor and regulator CCHC(Zn) family n=1 Tax=Rosa chinensis TaxID=74649 RepID=A0A2P6SDV0_ROSCH|nr:putative transcription factor interactor and regulator CCHC(Zn) family [Rosa chinensis]
MTDPPSLNTVFTYIRKDESQQESVKHAQVEASSLAIQSKSPAPFLHQQSSAPLLQQGFPQGFTNRTRPQCSYCNDLGHVRETCWKLNPHLKPKKQGYRPKAKAAAVQLVQEPDFYGVVGQDHHTAGGVTPTASIAGRGSSHQGVNRSGVSKGQIVPSGSDIRRGETRSTVSRRFDFEF